MSDREASPPRRPARDSPPSKNRSRSRSPRRTEDRSRRPEHDSHSSRDKARNMDRRDRDGDDRRDRDREDRPRPKKKNFGGFAYKDKRRDDDRDDRDEDRRGGGGSSFRGYRNRSRSPRRRPRDDDGDRRGGDRGGSYRDGGARRDGGGRRERDREDTTKPPKRAAPKEMVPVQGFIVVHVNDRLGTKVAIPCLPTDTVGQFKILVASKIGRKPEEIKLQKQGERPLKDMITLADYEISNGRQLDLEVGTND
ncbi:putative Ubiquitin-like modifier HUB1 [Seiridium unicorne]|uniref:Ubiquitin-like modifier HUB1 n=1 Tax=Seiridium unicorne TaxID=138068 RepID=A0ABR2VGK0_9PEZI